MADALFSNVVALLNFVNDEVLDRSNTQGVFDLNNGAALVSGTPTVMRLDGSNDYVLGPGGSNYSFPGQFCIEVICRKTAAGASNYDTALTTDTSNGSANSGWTIELGTTRGFTFVANAGALLLSAAESINDGEIHHWSCRRGSDNIVRLAKDGAQRAASSAYSATIASTGLLGVGRNDKLIACPFAGDVLAVRITKGSARYSGTSFTPDGAPFYSPFYSPVYTLSGNVKDATDALAARKVVAYREDTNALVATTVSDGTTGAYSISSTANTAHTLVFYPADGESLNTLTLRGVVPIET